MSPTTVFLKKIFSYNLDEVMIGINECFANFGGIKKILGTKENILIKPNFLIPSLPTSAVCTHKNLVFGVAKVLKDNGYKPFIGDSPSMGAAHQIAEKLELDKILKDEEIKIVEFKTPVLIKLPFPKIKYFWLEKLALEADGIINLPKLKAHQQLIISGATKNLFGCVNGKRKPLFHLLLGDRGLLFAEMLVAICQYLKPDFTIVDGIEAMEKKGPTDGKIRKLNLLIAGCDWIAIDRIIQEIVGSEELSVIKAAKKLNLGTFDLNKINLRGENLAEVKINNFQFPVLIPIGFSPLKLAKSITKNALILCKNKFRTFNEN